MDYIRTQLDKRIELLQTIGDDVDLIVNHQSRFEYILVYIMAYLWNRNIQKLDEPAREHIFQKIIKPSIGTIVDLCRTLDVDKEILKDSRLKNFVEEYPKLRNNFLGHGYSFKDSKLMDKFKELYNCVLDTKVSILLSNVDLVRVISIEGDYYKGVNYKSDGSVTAWRCPKRVGFFEVDNIYGFTDTNSYFRLSPFIEIETYGTAFYCFSNIEEKLLGKIRYKKLLETGTCFREWEDLATLNIVEDGIKVKTSNGTILNVYEKNYKKYISMGIKKKVCDFLITNKASVCATIWGHGGVGKTATIQSVCDDLANGEKKVFDHIVFLSAKDRQYDYYTGSIEEIKDAISSFEDLIKGINKVVFNIDNCEIQPIVDYSGRMLIVVDDFETFSKEDKDKIDDFISNLNTNNHKVIITTRAANIKIGQEFQTNELSKEETKKFLMEVIVNELLDFKEIIEHSLTDSQNLEKVFDITNGRPLFIFQFAIIVGHRGINDALDFQINKKETAINFLYGRIYDYLSPNAKDLFVALSLLVDKNSLVNVIEKAMYILNMEQDIDVFNSAINELIKLRIIKFVDDENRFFEVYSIEILQIMSDYFQRQDVLKKRNWISRRDQINKDKTKDIEHSLLLTANSNRLAKNEIEVIESYKQIIERTTSPLGIKREALLNLASYLVIDRGKKNDALKYLDDNRHLFDKNAKKGSLERKEYALFSKMWASYYWANGTKKQKDKAIEILLEYAKFGFNYNEGIDLELAGLLLQYRSVLIVSEWLDLKEKKEYGDISEDDFRDLRKKQKQICKSIHDNQGVYLFRRVSSKKLTEMNHSGARQNIITGLYSFIDVLVRLQKFDLAIHICKYVIDSAPENFHLQFSRKKDWISRISYGTTNCSRKPFTA